MFRKHLSSSVLHHQLYVISGLALRTHFENYAVAFCWPVFPQYLGMRLYPLHTVSASKIRILLKTMNVNITLTNGYWDSNLNSLAACQAT